MKYLYFLFLFAFACETKTVEGPPGPVRIVEIPSEPNPDPLPTLPPRGPDFNAYAWLLNDALISANSPEVSRQENLAFVTTFNFYNQGIREQELEEKGLNFFLNSISNSSRVYKAVPANESKSLYRIDLDDLEISPSQWLKIEENLKIKIADASRRGEQLRFVLQKRYPVVFASDLAAAIMQGDETYAQPGNLVYYEITRQPLDRAGFEVSVFGDSFQDRVDAEDSVYCSGGGNSQIAINKNRQICVSEGLESYVLDTLDTSLEQNDSAFENPFIPEIARAGGRIISDSVFNFAAQEAIFIKRNGFMGYRLNGAVGEQIAETIAPASVVTDLAHAALRLSPQILIGSCANCHTSPFLDFKDQINDHVQQNQFSGLEKLIIDTYYDQDEFNRQGQEMNSDYFRVVGQIGIKQGDPSFMHKYLIQPIRGELTAEEIAGFTGLKLDDFLLRLRGASENTQTILGPLFLPGGKVQLSDLQRVFGTLQVDLNLFTD